MVTQDRRGAYVQDVAIKAPVLVATTGNITLAGVQTIDGVSVGNNSERVLVKDQTDKTQNGIYNASTGNWSRTTDASKNTDFVKGTVVVVAAGVANISQLFEQTCADSPVVLGTSQIAFLVQGTEVATDNGVVPSTSSLAIGAGSQAFTIGTGKNLSVGQWVLIWSNANSDNQMVGKITAYTGGILTVLVQTSNGAGTFADWRIALQGSPATVGLVVPITTSLDLATIATTGDFKFRATSETLTGWVRANARTIGDGSSGATERANADTANLFAWHWNNFSNAQCAVSGGRGANAAADFAAHKTIVLLDLRRTGIMGLDDMGGSAASGFTSVPFVAGNATTAGSVAGANTHTLTIPQIPTITPAGTIVIGSASSLWSGHVDELGSPGVSGFNPTSFADLTNSAIFNGTPFGGGGAHNNVPRAMLGTCYLKL